MSDDGAEGAVRVRAVSVGCFSLVLLALPLLLLPLLLLPLLLTNALVLLLLPLLLLLLLLLALALITALPLLPLLLLPPPPSHSGMRYPSHANSLSLCDWYTFCNRSPNPTPIGAVYLPTWSSSYPTPAGSDPSTPRNANNRR